MSSSQLREHGCWLFASDGSNTPDSIRSWMGDFTKIRNTGKYAARLGQSLSSSIETFDSDTTQFTTIPDIQVRAWERLHFQRLIEPRFEKSFFLSFRFLSYA